MEGRGRRRFTCSMIMTDNSSQPRREISTCCMHFLSCRAFLRWMQGISSCESLGGVKPNDSAQGLSVEISVSIEVRFQIGQLIMKFHQGGPVGDQLSA